MIVYPKHPTADDTYFIDGAWAPAAITAREKRFTEAELAAEYWRLCYYGAGLKSKGIGEVNTHYDRLATLARFATLPHFDHDQETA